jgi:putative adenylate-forming enzyme
MIEALDILRWFLIARRLDAIRSREALAAHQARWLARLRRTVLPRSPFYASIADAPYESWPVMSKATWMAAFDEINTRGIRRDEAMAVAEAAEQSRDFSPTLHGIAVGLSTGTSGQRGLFLVSPAERRRWAGVMLAKLLPPPVTARRRVAFFLRASSRLYEEVQGSGRIAFRFFDLMRPLEDMAGELQAFAPDVLIAPPSVLRILARFQESGGIRLQLVKAVSIAEVLDHDDRRVVEAAFGLRLDEVYQATEGALAMTCEAGSLHLNEAFVMVETRWLDREAGRFSPIVTDLTRATQPVVRYLLDDVLVAAPTPCACGRASRTILAVEGRADDVCAFLAPNGAEVRVFPDYLSRAILGAAPGLRDFRAAQSAPGRLRIFLDGAEGADAATRVEAALRRLAAELGAAPPEIAFPPWSPAAGSKRRRITRE